MSPPWKIMKLLAMITTLYVSLLVLLTPYAAAAPWQVQLQSSHGQANNGLQSLPLLRAVLPRKLLEEVFVPRTKGKEDHKGSSLSGKQNQHHKEPIVKHGSVGTRQEWMEAGTDTSQYFTMDYSQVRRRRPIHNKSVPVGP